MALPSSPPITMGQIKGEFKKGNNLRAYLGCAPGVPTSGSIKQTDLLGKSAADFHYGFPNTFEEIDLGYYYSYVLNDKGSSNLYPAGSLDEYYGDNFGAYQDYAQTQLQMKIVNTYDFAYVYNSYGTQFFCVDSDKFNAGYSNIAYWVYSNSVGSNAIYFIDFNNSYYNATYSWLYQAYTGKEYFLELY